MSIADEVRAFIDQWIMTVTGAIETAADRILGPRHILLDEGENGLFTAKVISARDGSGLPPLSFAVTPDVPAPALPVEWQAAFRGGQIDVTLRSDRVMFCPLDFPAQAANFLDGMIRAQIDRLTPWTADNAEFGWAPSSKPVTDRVEVMFAAMPKLAAEPFLRLARMLNVASISLSTVVPTEDGGAETVRLLSKPLRSKLGQIANVPQILRIVLLSAGVAAAASLAAGAYLGSTWESEQQDIQRQISQRRAALNLGPTGDAGVNLLAKRKQSTPASVMVLESLSRVMPDTTYVTELHIEGDKVQVVGLTQDAPSLIGLLEKSPQFTRATFFAPTTRAQNESGERFHIEAHIVPSFGSGI